MRELIAIIVLVLITGGILKLFGMHVSFNVLPLFLPGEKVLFFKRWVWAASAKSPPTNRVWVSPPPLLEHGLYITDRRVLNIFHMFRLLTQDFSQWFEGKAEAGDADLVKDVTVGKNLLGSYLEVVSESPVKPWYRSRRFRLRLYLRNPAFVCQIISEAMRKTEV